MRSMSLDKIDQYIRELEAIKNYNKVKAENERLSAEVRKLRSKNESLKNEVSAKKNEIEMLRRELSAKEEEIQRLSREVEELSSRVRELEELKALADGKSLKEALELFLKVKEEEVEKKARELFEKLRSEWESRKKPKEVSKEALKALKAIIEATGSGLKLVPVEAAEAGLVEEVEKLLRKEVERRLDEESERKSLEKLERLKSMEWPAWFSSWYKERVEPQINRLESEIRQNAIKALRGPWNLNKRCDRCGTPLPSPVTLTDQEIEELLRSGSVSVECQNPNCLDYILYPILPAGRHRVSITLRELIRGWLQAQ